MHDYYELKGNFLRACEWHQEGNANEGGTSLCSLCRYGADNGRGECFAHWMFDVLTGRFAIGDRLIESRTLTERKSANASEENAKNDADLPIACKKTAHNGKDIDAPTTDVVVVNLPYIYPKKTSATDTNVGHKLPSWVKVGQWVVASFDLEWNKRPKDCVLKRITELDSFGGILVETLKGEREYGGWSEYVPVRFRAYTYEEAKDLLGKVMELDYENGCKRAMLIDCIGNNDGRVSVNGYKQESLMKRIPVTIDGVPFGVPEIDEEAMKGGAK